MKRKQLSAMHAVLIIYTFIAIILALVVYIFIWQNNIRIDEEINSRMQRRVDQQSLSVQKVLEGQFSVLEAYANYMGSLTREDEELFFGISKAMMETEGFVRITIAGFDGTSLTSDGVRGNVSERKYFQQAIRGEDTISEPLMSGVDRDYEFVMLAVPVKTPEGAIIGMLGGSYSSERFSELFMENDYWNSFYSVLVRQDGEVLVGTKDTVSILKGNNIFQAVNQTEFLDENSVETVQNVMKEGGRQSVLLRKDGVDYYLSQAPFGYNDWVLFTVVQRNDIDSGYDYIWHNSRYMTLCFIIVFVVSTILLIYIFQRERGRAEAESVKVQRELQVKAETDMMTGILNKTATEDSVRNRLIWMGEEEGAVILVDVDDLKKINDTRGHLLGDKAICAVADVLKSHFRSSDIIGRIGGDEFMIFLPHVGGMPKAQEIMENLVNKLQSIEIGDEEKLFVGGSVGGVMTSMGGDFWDLYEKADRALYHVKRQKKGGWALYEPYMEQEEYKNGGACIRRT